ncbi:uncharacterized protein LAESUDRAFT_307291 [Laetiporus sulphureus 93-53]|uniref:Uncharacterized protein n=1 Tax=Laetiporus sulphureus 93-53 TaxID=1314785 RepID=A0A165D9E3_9APHY|nr:uncharacterized protein LAESUDRAFT_307291 [Laetiporus sulphureus 93-53]KZT04376.1 hypothetical protein LAESUDRAFT_307291 [Laetiporus sulphureus 93-53]
MRSIVATRHSGLATIVDLARCGAPNKTTPRKDCQKSRQSRLFTTYLCRALLHTTRSSWFVLVCWWSWKASWRREGGRHEWTLTRTGVYTSVAEVPLSAAVVDWLRYCAGSLLISKLSFAQDDTE